MQGQLRLHSLDLSHSLAAPLPTDPHHSDDAAGELGEGMGQLRLNGAAAAPQQDTSSGATSHRRAGGDAGVSRQQGTAGSGGVGGCVGACCVGGQRPGAERHSSGTSSEAAAQQLFAVSLRSALMRLPGLTGERKTGQGVPVMA